MSAFIVVVFDTALNGNVMLHLSVRKRLLVAFCCVLIVIPTGAQQVPVSSLDLRIVPPALRSSLLKRLELFVESQRNEDWQRVSELLGPWRRDSNTERQYTAAHKRCLIEQMKARRITDFRLIDVSFGIEPVHRSLMNRRWHVRGEAQFDGINNAFKPLALIAYRDNGLWYFTPPNFDGEWEIRSGIRTVEPDVQNSLKLNVPRDCPLEIVDLSIVATQAYGYRARRIVTFKLHNKAKKEITGLSFRLERVDGLGSTSRGMPFQIKAGETVQGPSDTSYAGKVFYCEEEASWRLIIQSVSFEDGSEWMLKRSRF